MKTVYFILGMHRSGTSALAGVLSQIGLNFGTYLMEKNANNPKGYFENNHVYLLNKKILSEHNGNWDDYDFDVSIISEDKKKQYIEEIKSIIQKEFKYSEQFVIKDPRICLLFPIWVKALNELNIHVKTLIAYRNPMEVAESLLKRDKFSYEKSLLLWQNHIINAEYHSRPFERIFVNFDDLLEETSSVLQHIGSFLDVNISEKVEKKTIGFLEKGMRNSHIPMTNFTQEAPNFLRKTIDILIHKNFEDKNTFDQIRKDFEYIKDLFSQKEIHNLCEQLNKKNENLQNQLVDNINDSGKKVRELKEKLNGLEKENAIFIVDNQKIVRLTNKLNTLESEKNKEINGLNSEIEDIHKINLNLEKKNRLLILDLENQSKELKQKKLENDENLKKLNSQIKELEISEKNNIELNKENQELVKRVLKLESKNKNHLAEKEAVQQQNLKNLLLSQKYEKLILTLEQDIKSVEKDLRTNKSLNTNQQEEIAVLDSKLENLENALHEAQCELNKKISDEKRLQTEIERLKFNQFNIEKTQKNFKHNLELFRQYTYKYINLRVEQILSNFDNFQSTSFKKLLISKKNLAKFMNEQFMVLHGILRIQEKHNRLPNKFIELFEQDQYLQQNTDVKEAIENKSLSNAIEHFINFGYDEIEAGNRHLYTNTNLFNEIKKIEKNNNSLTFDDFLSKNHLALIPPKTNAARKILALTNIKGALNEKAKAQTVLICAHIAGKYLFGSERSFLDMVKAAYNNGYNVIITLPQMQQSYIDILLPYVNKVIVFKYGWWRKNLQINNEVINTFENIIISNHVNLVHVNTIMLREPIIAAKHLDVRSITHVRELIDGDESLINLIGKKPDEISRIVYHSSNFVLANSHTTAKLFTDFNGYQNKVTIIHNTVDVKQFNCDNIIGDQIKVGLISSNIPKKGIYDFIDVAKKCEAYPHISFLLIGPDTEHTQELVQQQKEGEIGNNVIFAGYKATALEAINEVNIVVSVSNFTESFGRTVIEGMAACRPVVAYRWGAVAELISDGVDGYLTDYRDTNAIADRIIDLASSKEKILRMGHAGKLKAQEFSLENYSQKMLSLYEHCFKKQTTIAKRTDLKIAYFMWHFPVPSETFVLNELRQLKEKGYDVLVYCKQSPYKDFKPDFDIEWKRINSPDELAFLLENDKREVVHSHFTYPTVTDMVWPACEKSKVPFTFIAHAQDIFRYANDKKNRIDEISQSELCRCIFVPSRFHHKFLSDRKVPANKMVINPNGVDTDLYISNKIINIEKRVAQKICAVHRFTEKKGLENLILAAKQIKSDTQIDIYGYGELENAYLDLIKQHQCHNVTIKGSVKSRAHMLEVFAEYDLFACPSVRAKDGDMDGIPTVLMEAMAAGIPVISTAISGIPDLITDEITGIITESTAESIADGIDRFYGLPDSKVQFMINNARNHIINNFDSKNLVSNLLDVWKEVVVNLIIVSWNNLPELKEVIRRLLKYTSLPHKLTICDNNSEKNVTQYLRTLNKNNRNVEVIFNTYNAMVGPGTNLALEKCGSDYAIYVCGKEGFVFDYGWEQPLVKYMNENSDVGLAGTLGYSPTYLKGKDYPSGISEFPRFRNKKFAKDNPDRIFKHIQGGFFIMRLDMYHQIGGFSEDVPHNYTDVEYSYYVESRGWKLGQIDKMLALFNKTRPGIFSRVDDSMLAIHPPTLEELPKLDKIMQKKQVLCSVCYWQGAEFIKKEHLYYCPECNSSGEDRSLLRYLAESIFTHRRLPALAINLNEPMHEIWKQQFQGRILQDKSIFEEIKKHGKINNADHGSHVIYLSMNQGFTDEQWLLLLSNFKRLLNPEGELIIKQNQSHTNNQSFLTLVKKIGFSHTQYKGYSSQAIQYDWLKFTVLKP